jgi:hypothetical protein
MSTLDTISKRHAANLEALQALDGVLLGQGYIIMAGDLAIQPELAHQPGGKWLLTGATPCQVTEAPRFDIDTAATIAISIKNGAGIPGRHVHIRQALLEEVERLKILIVAIATI